MTATMPVIPQRVWDLMAEIGPKWGTDIRGHVGLMAKEFSALLATAPKEGVVTRDLAYGRHPRQILDLYAPKGALSKAPVVIFLHGGAFVDGNKDRTPEIYANVGWYLARHGILTINLEYRLAPEFKYPAAAEDTKLALQWAKENIARFGGDPDRIFLMGHSAGAAHVGVYAYDPTIHGPGGPGIAGLILVSGRVRTELWPDNPNAPRVEAYLGTDPAMLERGSVVAHVRPDCPPTMIAIAEYENPLLDIHNAELFYKLAHAKRRAPRLVWMPRHNHHTSIAQLNTAEDTLGQALLEFIRLGR